MKRENLDKAPNYLRQIYPMENSWSSLIQRLEIDSGFVEELAFSPDGKWLVSGQYGGNITLWDSAGSLSKKLKDHSNTICSVAFSSNSQTILSGSDDCTVKLWSLTGTLENKLRGHSDTVLAVASSPDNERIASASADCTVRIWNSKGDLENILKGHSDIVVAVAFSPDNKRIASASHDTTARIWNSAGDLENILEGHSSGLFAVAFTTDGKRIATASADYTVRIWNSTGGLENTLTGHSGEIHRVVFSSDGTKIVSWSLDYTIKFWAVAGVLEKTIEHLGPFYALALSSDNKRVAVSFFSEINIWNIAGQVNNAHTCKSDKSLGQVRRLTISPNGKQFASTSLLENTIRISDVATLNCQKVLEGHCTRVIAFAFSPSGSHLASGSRDGTIKIWNTATGEIERSFEVITDTVAALSFLPDGVHVISASRNGTLTSWNIKTGKTLRKIEGYPRGYVQALTVSSCGGYLATTSDGIIEIWSSAQLLRPPKFRDRFLGQGSKSLPLKCIETSYMSMKRVRFSTDGRLLLTSYGPIVLGEPRGDNGSAVHNPSAYLVVRDQWIQYGSFSFLRLPGEYMPSTWRDGS